MIEANDTDCATSHTGLSVVVPMYNETENAVALCHEIATMLRSLNRSVELVVVDDNSSDNTLEILKGLQQDIPFLTVLRHVNNAGQSTAVANGVRAARYEVIATLDGDGQNDPNDIPKLLALWEQKAQQGVSACIAGHRANRKDTWVKKISSKIANAIRQKCLRDDCPDSGCGLKLFGQKEFLQLPLFNHCHRFLPALFNRAGVCVINATVNHRPRQHGYSKYGTWNRLWTGIVDMMGVMWLIRRPCHQPVINENETTTPDVNS